jgi:single-stranded-DNA-specific exonuclease
MEVIEKIIDEYNLLDNKILIIPIADGLVDKNLSGLVANQLSNKYQRPTLILRETIKDGVKSWEGSARSYNFNDFKDFLFDTGLTMYAEGHQGAFGVGILDENFAEFIETTNRLLENVKFEQLYMVDFIFDVSELTDSIIYEIANYNDIWGQNLKEPLILINNVKVTKNALRFMGSNGRTMRIDIPNSKISFIKFFIKDEEKEELDPAENGYLLLDIIGTFQKNVFNGYTSPQIQIEDYEIVKRVDYYF